MRVDGVSFNDDFGLNANGYPAQRSPISLNAIEQLAVKVAPASVEYSGFRGGVIEIITKSGTNDFTGEVFFYDRGDSLMGNESEGQKYQFELDDTSEGFAFGGPIIKDKAFFTLLMKKPRSQNLSHMVQLALVSQMKSGLLLQRLIILDQSLKVFMVSIH